MLSFHSRTIFPPVTESTSSETDAKQQKEAEATAEQLPTVPTTEPGDGEHTNKKPRTDE